MTTAIELRKCRLVLSDNEAQQHNMVRAIARLLGFVITQHQPTFDMQFFNLMAVPPTTRGLEICGISLGSGSYDFSAIALFL